MDTYQMILQGDSLAALKNMDNEEIFDLVLLDPPYFDYKTNHRKDKEDKLSKSLIQQSRDDQLETVRESIKRLKSGGSFFFFTNWREAWWFQEKFQSFLVNEIIWDKGNWTAGSLDNSLGNRYEVIFLGIKGNWHYRGSRIQDIWGNLYEKDNQYNLNRVGTKRLHPTEKPVDLYRKCIDIATDSGMLVFDAYAGSGSSAVAAYLTGRNFLGYDLDIEFCKRANERLNNIKQNKMDKEEET